MKRPVARKSDVPPGPNRIEWDRVTAVIAVLVGVLALAVSAYTAYLQHAQVRAQTWPLLQLWQSNSLRSFSLSNRGVGPARVLDAKVYLDDLEVEGFQQIFKALSGEDRTPNSTQSYFVRRVLAANEDVAMIQFEEQADYDLFAANRQRIAFDICYCSVIDQCYRLNERAETEREYLAEVSSCSTDTPGKFR
ncbi:MAG: hypothetical protein IPK97_07775 [Ahniella sp.]|nr:hypothetical protein [Ahniella sp.]